MAIRTKDPEESRVRRSGRRIPNERVRSLRIQQRFRGWDIPAGVCIDSKAANGCGRQANEEAVLRTLVDNLPDLIYVKDLNGRFLLANNAVARIMGATKPSDLLGKNDFDFHPKELATRYHDDEQALIRSGEPLSAREEECRDPAGNLVFLETTRSAAARCEQGRVTGLVGIGRNITLR